MMEANQAGMYPTADKVMILPVKIETKSKGGIVIPDAAKSRIDVASQHGKVIAMGDAARIMSETKGIEIGDMVVFARFAGVEQPGKDGQIYRIMRATDVMAKCEGAFMEAFDATTTPQPSPFR